jgi:hypothetical protein
MARGIRADLARYVAPATPWRDNVTFPLVVSCPLSAIRSRLDQKRTCDRERVTVSRQHSRAGVPLAAVALSSAISTVAALEGPVEPVWY